MLNIQWGEPRPLRQAADTMPFPLNALPPVLRNMAKAISVTTSTDVGMAGTAMLSAVGYYFSGIYRLAGMTDHTEPPVLYSLIIAQPSERKSPVMHFIKDPFDSFESKYNKEHREEIYKAQQDFKALEVRVKSMEKEDEPDTSAIAKLRVQADNIRNTSYERMKQLTDNPCKRVTVPRGEKKEKDIYTLKEVEKFFQLLETAPLKYRVFFTLAIYSGFRRGEMLGLEWKDIDWENCVISVRRTSNYTALKGIYTDTTKTKKSQRSLKFPQCVMDMLREYKDEQDAERERLGTKWVDYDRLFVKWNGEPMNNNTPYFWLKEFCEENNFRFCDIHSLRHFYASALINKGVDAAAVSGALGHSTITTTTSIYCHVFGQAQARAGEAIASVLDFHKSDEPKGQPKAV